MREKKGLIINFYGIYVFFFAAKCKENTDELVINKKNWIHVNSNYSYYLNPLEQTQYLFLIVLMRLKIALQHSLTIQWPLII